MNKMGEENGNERYLVNVSKLEKLMEEKRNEQNVKRIRALFKNSDIGIDVRAEDTLDTAYSTYTTIISKKSATKKTLQLLADYLKLSSFKELVAEDNSMIERVSCILCDGDTALIAFVQEDNTMYFDNVLNTFQDVSITRWDAAILEQEIETARVLQEEFEKTAKKELREKKSQERKMKAEERRAKMKHEFEQLKEKKHNK